MADSSPSPSAAPAPNPARLGTLYPAAPSTTRSATRSSRPGSRRRWGSSGRGRRSSSYPPTSRGSCQSRAVSPSPLSSAERPGSLLPPAEDLSGAAARYHAQTDPPACPLPLRSEMACACHDFYGEAVADVMPTLGTHFPMSDDEIAKMYPTIPRPLFRAPPLHFGNAPPQSQQCSRSCACAGAMSSSISSYR